MKSKNNMLYFYVFLIVGIGIYSLCAFVLVDEYSYRFWLAYVFTVIAFLIQILVPFIAFSKETENTDIFLGIPLFIPGSIYLAVQLIIGVGIMIVPLSFRVALLIEAVCFACFILVMIVLTAGKEVIIESDVETEKSIEFIKNLTLQAEKLYEEGKGTEREVELKRLWEAVRYSDPVSKDVSVHMIDSQIEKAFLVVCRDLQMKSIGELSQEVKSVVNLVNKRNVVCRMKK